MQLYIYNKLKLVFFVVPLFLLLSACAIRQGFDGFDRASHKIQSIALLEVENPAYLVIHDPHISERLVEDLLRDSIPLPWYLDLVGSLVDRLIKAKQEQLRSKPLEQIVNEYGFNFGRLITKELERNLRRANYEVVIIPRSDRKNMISMDAYLDVQAKAMGYLYFSKGYPIEKSGYIPWINVEITLVDDHSGETLYFEEVNYGPDGSTINAESRYILKGNDISFLFENNKELVIETLHVGTSAIAEQISINLAH
jgi:hypothetical protein